MFPQMLLNEFDGKKKIYEGNDIDIMIWKICIEFKNLNLFYYLLVILFLIKFDLNMVWSWSI